jgi:CheY-like chemotaxis protein
MPTRSAVRLLIADDDPDTLAAYVLFFDAQGYQTRALADGAQALAEYSAWHPDAVVLDVQMPGMDGRAVAREIRYLQFTPAPLLVAVTALTSPAEKAKSLSAGFNHHFAKPADLPVILAAIAAHLSRAATHKP